MPRLLALVVAFFAMVASVGFAQSGTTYFATIPTISPTTTLSAGHVCATDGRDIYCDGSLPLTAGLGVGDRIISGSQAAIINSATGVISLTTAGTGWGYLAPTSFSYLPYLNTLGVSATGTVSATNGYFAGNVGILTAPAADALTVNGVARANGGFTVTNYGSLTGSSSPAALTLVTPSKDIVLSPGSTERLRAVASTGYVGIGIATPSSALHIVGVSSTAGGLTLGDTLGVTRLQVYPTGSQSIMISNPAVGGTISFKTTNGGNVVIQNSATLVYASFSAVNGSLGLGYGIGATNSATLHVSGTALFISDTNTLGETSTTSVKIAAAAGAPDSSKCVGGSDYGRIVQGSDNRLFLCVPR